MDGNKLVWTWVYLLDGKAGHQMNPHQFVHHPPSLQPGPEKQEEDQTVHFSNRQALEDALKTFKPDSRKDIKNFSV